MHKIFNAMLFSGTSNYEKDFIFPEIECVIELLNSIFITT